MNREYTPKFLVVREGETIPTASVDLFMARAIVQVAATEDEEYVCLRNAAGTYSWINTTVAAATVAPANAQIVSWQSKDTGFTALDTTTRSMDTLTFGPLLNGVTYDIVVDVHMRLSIDTTGFARAYARWENDTQQAGERTGTVGGERSCCASTSALGVAGDGSTTYSARSRADMDVNTGTCSSSHIRVIATPRA